MDVEGVECVVNYEIPHQFKTYLHRVGRTARAGERGVAYTLLAPEEVIYLMHLAGTACANDSSGSVTLCLVPAAWHTSY